MIALGCDHGGYELMQSDHLPCQDLLGGSVQSPLSFRQSSERSSS